MRTLSRQQLTAALAARQLLLERRPLSPAKAIARLTPLQGQHPPAGHWDDKRRPGFIADPRPLPAPAAAAALVLRRYLAAFGSASLRDAAAWAGAAQRDFAAAAAGPGLVRRRDERGTELLDLRRAPLPPASTRLPVRFLSNWGQPLLAYADRERILPAELLALRLTISGDPVVTVDGRVAARWSHGREDGVCHLNVVPLVDLSRAHIAAVRAEARRTAPLCAQAGDRIEITVGHHSDRSRTAPGYYAAG